MMPINWFILYSFSPPSPPQESSPTSAIMSDASSGVISSLGKSGGCGRGGREDKFSVLKSSPILVIFVLYLHILPQQLEFI